MMVFSSLTLTHDELLSLLLLLQCPTINGLPDDPMQALSDDEVQARLNAGEQTLLERGLLTYPEDASFALAPRVVDLVGGAAMPSASLVVGQMGPGGHRASYFGATPKTLFAHDSPRPGIYEFWAIADAEDLAWLVEGGLTELAQMSTEENDLLCKVNAVEFSEFLLGAERGQGTELLRAMLHQDALPEEAIEDLCADPAALRIWYAVAGTGLDQDEIGAGDAAIVIAGKSSLWLLENVPDNETVATLCTATPLMATQRLMDVVALCAVPESKPGARIAVQNVEDDDAKT